jgi:hypothetical protein
MKYVAKLKKDGPRKLPEKAPADKKPRDPRQVDRNIMAMALKIYNQPLPAITPQQLNQDVSDNSNTQFAMLALWVARRYGMPVDRALVGTELRFRQTQHKNGGWSYELQPYDPKVPATTPRSAMTAVGLISLALGNACTPPQMKRDLNKDEQMKAGLYVIGATIGDTGQGGGLSGKSFYFLWTLERMAVIYGFKTIGDKDWYRWGAEMLVAGQNKDNGSWIGEYQSPVDTCFALLFLKRVNVAFDLTPTIPKVKDPGKPSAELLDLIGRTVQPGVDNMPKKDAPKKNNPEPAPPPAPPPSVPEFRPAEFSAGGPRRKE